MSGQNLVERLAERYKDSPLRGLVQFTPLTAALDTALLGAWTTTRHRRFEALLDALNDGTHTLTQEDIQREEFLHAFFTTVEATLRTQRHEKIAWFGRLLLACFGANAGHLPASEHEDMLKVLDDLSYREIGILVLLLDYERRHETNGDDSARRRQAKGFWDDFTSEACAKFGIPGEELPGMLVRLARSGMYTDFPEGFGGWGEPPQILSYVTPNFKRLARTIRIENKSFVP